MHSTYARWNSPKPEYSGNRNVISLPYLPVMTSSQNLPSGNTLPLMDYPDGLPGPFGRGNRRLRGGSYRSSIGYLRFPRKIWSGEKNFIREYHSEYSGTRVGLVLPASLAMKSHTVSFFSVPFTALQTSMLSGICGRGFGPWYANRFLRRNSG